MLPASVVLQMDGDDARSCSWRSGGSWNETTGPVPPAPEGGRVGGGLLRSGIRRGEEGAQLGLSGSGKCGWSPLPLPPAHGAVMVRLNTQQAYPMCILCPARIDRLSKQAMHAPLEQQGSMLGPNARCDGRCSPAAVCVSCLKSLHRPAAPRTYMGRPATGQGIRACCGECVCIRVAGKK